MNAIANGVPIFFNRNVERGDVTVIYHSNANSANVVIELMPLISLKKFIGISIFPDIEMKFLIFVLILPNIDMKNP